MRLRGWDVERFGGLVDHRYRLPEGAGGLLVVHGPNEAGKSTLLRFINAMLFGAPGPGAGRLLLEHGGRRLVLRRNLEARRGGFSLLGEDGRELGPDGLAALLGGVDARVYKAVFAFGLKELAELASLTAEGVQERIFSAGISGAGASARAGLNAVRAETDALLRPRASSALGDAAGEYLRLRDDLRRLQADAAAYAGLLEAEGRLGEEVRDLDGRLADAAARARRLEVTLQAWPSWCERRDAARHLEAYAGPRELPPVSEAQLEFARAEEGRLEGAVRALESACERQGETAARLAGQVDGTLLAAAGPLRAASGELPLQRSRQRETADGEAALAGARQELARRLADLGPGWDLARLARLDRSLERQAEARQFAEATATLGGKRLAAANRAGDARAALERARERAASAAPPDGRLLPLEPELRALHDNAALQRNRLAELERRAVERERLERALAGLAPAATAPGAASRDERERAVARLRGRLPALAAAGAATKPRLPLWAWLLPLLPLALGGWLLASGQAPAGAAAVAAALLTLAAVAALGRSLAAPAAGIADGDLAAGIRQDLTLLGLPAGADIGRVEEAALALTAERRRHDEARAAAAALADARAEAARLEAPARAWEDRAVDALRAAAGASGARPAREGLWGEELVAAVERTYLAAQEALARAAEARAAQAAVSAASTALAGAEGELARVDEQLRQARERWRAWCRAHGVPDGHSPEDALKLFAAAETASLQERAVLDLEARLTRLRGESREWLLAARAAVAAAGREAPGDGELPAAVERLARELNEHEECARAAADAAVALEAKRRDLGAARGELERARLESGRLLAAAGAASDDELRAAHEQHRRYLAWKDTMERAESELRRHAGAQLDAITAELEAADPLAWEESLHAARHEREELARQRDAAHEARARKTLEREQLEASGETAELNLKLGVKREQLLALARRWLVTTLAGEMIGETLREYERTKGPEVLRRASATFSTVTGGRYTRVLPVDGRPGLRVASEDDEFADASTLSRGTQEQLYLAVRLGLARLHGERTAPLPLVMDDVLVNADRERARATARAIAEVAAEHQVLYLTCHEHCVDTFLELDRQCAVLELPRLGTSLGAPPDSPGAGSGDPERAVLDALERAGDWLLTSDLRTSTALDDGDLQAALAALQARGVVERGGQRRGTRYRLALLPATV